MKNIKTKNIENIGWGKGGWENPLANRSTRSPIRLQTPYDLAADRLLLLLIFKTDGCVLCIRKSSSSYHTFDSKSMKSHLHSPSGVYHSRWRYRVSLTSESDQITVR